MSANEILANQVWAQQGTRAEDVLRRIMEINEAADPSKRLNLRTGLFGESPPSGSMVILRICCRKNRRSYSLRYERGAGNCLIIPIGVDLPEPRIDGAAKNILAMIRRGRHWQDAKGLTYPEAYGLPSQPNNRKQRCRQQSRLARSARGRSRQASRPVYCFTQ
jgi:hypothetical protein